MALNLLDGEERITVSDADLEDVADGDKDVTYEIRVLDANRQRAIVERNTKKTFNRKTHKPEPETDWTAVVQQMLDEVLVGWTGILYRGDPAPCTAEFKDKLDAARKAAILAVAGYMRPASDGEAVAESFRPASHVV